MLLFPLLKTKKYHAFFSCVRKFIYKLYFLSLYLSTSTCKCAFISFLLGYLLWLKSNLNRLCTQLVYYACERVCTFQLPLKNIYYKENKQQEHQMNNKGGDALLSNMYFCVPFDSLLHFQITRKLTWFFLYHL